MGREEMRAGDADRQQVADRLRLAVDEGRLDLFEYDERLQRAYAAKTYGDLDRLLVDLPATVPAQRSALAPLADGGVVTPSRVQYPDATRRWLLENWSGYAGVVAICIGTWLAVALTVGEFIYFWPIWVIVPWGAVLVWSTISGLLSGEPQRWAARKDQRRQAGQVDGGRRKGQRHGCGNHGNGATGALHLGGNEPHLDEKA